MSTTPRLRLRLVPVMASALLTLLLVAPAAAQKLGGQAFRTSLGATFLMPGGDLGLVDPNVLTDADRLPSGRAVLEIQANPVFGFHLGAMRLAPKTMWADSTPFAGSLDPRSQIALTAGVVGFRLNFTTGRFRIGPFVDGGGGQAQARIDQGGYFYQEGGQVGYQPLPVDTTALMAGGGGGVVVDAILGPGLTLSALGGYWHYLSIDKNDQGDPLLDPLSGAWLGAGVKLSFRDASYYWRHSGKDSEPPVIAIQSPQPTEGGVVDVGQASTTLSLRVADMSDIDSVFVAGRKLQLIPNRNEKDPDVRSVLTSVDLTLNPGSNKVAYRAYDGAGNRIAGEWEVLGIPLDKQGPVITVLQPEPDLSISTPKIMVEAIIADRSPITQVTLGGLTMRPVEATAEERLQVGADPGDFVVKFSSTTNVPTARFDVVIAAVDSASNTQVSTIQVQRADLVVAGASQQQAPAQAQSRGPEIEIYTPVEWASGGTRGFAAQPKASIRVSGLARYSEGVKEVFANNKRMALQRDANTGAVQFSGFVAPPAPGSGGEVEILVRGNDGAQTVRTYSARTEVSDARGSQQFENIAGASKRQRWAVIIGVSDYTDKTIGNLQYADDDAMAMYEFLRSPAAGMGGFPEENIQLLVNEQATSRNIRSALTTFLRQSTPDDVVFLYIAAHGAPDPLRPDDLYILTHDTEIADIAATAISMADVNRSMESAYAYNKVLFTDACHSAGVGSSVGTRSGEGLTNNQINSAFLDYMNSAQGGFVAFTASQANQLSQEGEQFGGGHGVFTHYLLEGLKGAADDDGDRVVTLLEAMEYTRDRVRRETHNAQIPAISLTTYDQFWPMAAVLEGGDQDQE